MKKIFDLMNHKSVHINLTWPYNSFTSILLADLESVSLDNSISNYYTVIISLLL